MSSLDGAIVITGVGLAAPIGAGAREAFERLLRGESGIVRNDGERPLLSAPSPRPEFTGLRIPKNQKFLNAGARHLMWAGLRAFEQSGWNRDRVPAERLAVFTGSGQTGLEPSLMFPGFDAAGTKEGEGDWAALGGPASRSLDAFFPLRTLSNSGLALLAMELGARGPSNNFVQSDTAAVMALEAAMDALTGGECDVAVCGAYDSLLSPANYLNFLKAGLLTESAVRPFDRDADGTALGEAGAALVLERRTTAEARGAVILASVGRVAMAMGDGEGNEYPARSGAAITAAIRRALGESQPDVVVLSGMGVPALDRIEAAAVAAALLPGAAPCTAFKGATGYLGAATALVEMVLGIEALRMRQIPPVTGLAAVRGEISLDLVAASPRPMSGGNDSLHALCLSHSLMGQSAAVLLRSEVSHTG